MIVTYDEFGGQWDHVSPPGQGGTPGPHDIWGPGTRIPALVLAPGLRGNSSVDHTQYDTTSILATIEQRWNLAPLSSRDAAVNDLSSVFAAKRSKRRKRRCTTGASASRRRPGVAAVPSPKPPEPACKGGERDREGDRDPGGMPVQPVRDRLRGHGDCEADRHEVGHRVARATPDRCRSASGRPGRCPSNMSERNHVLTSQNEPVARISQKQ